MPGRPLKLAADDCFMCSLTSAPGSGPGALLSMQMLRQGLHVWISAADA